MGNRVVFFLGLFLLSNAAMAKFSLAPLIAQDKSIQDDISLILLKANLDKNLITFSRTKSDANTVAIKCTEDSKKIDLNISSLDEEWNSTLYLGLQKLGFLFPHPRILISPTLSEMKTHCGKTYSWRPALRSVVFTFILFILVSGWMVS